MSLIIFVILFVIIGNGIPIAIAYAAWKGHPRGFTRDSFFRGAILVGAAGSGLFLVSRRIVPTTFRQFLGAEICGYAGLLLVCVAGGFGLSIFTLRRRTPPQNHGGQ